MIHKITIKTNFYNMFDSDLKKLCLIYDFKKRI